MIDNINLIDSPVLNYTSCVTDTEMLECQERRHAFVTDGWMFCSVEKEITAFSKCPFPSCAGIPGCCVATGRAVSAMSDTPNWRKPQTVNRCCKTCGWLSQGWLGWWRLLSIRRWFATPLLLPPSPLAKRGNFASLWPALTFWDNLPWLKAQPPSALPCRSLGLYIDIRSSAGYRPGLHLKATSMPMPDCAVLIQPFDKGMTSKISIWCWVSFEASNAASTQACRKDLYGLLVSQW